MRSFSAESLQQRETLTNTSNPSHFQVKKGPRSRTEMLTMCVPTFFFFSFFILPSPSAPAAPPDHRERRSKVCALYRRGAHRERREKGGGGGGGATRRVCVEGGRGGGGGQSEINGISWEVSLLTPTEPRVSTSRRRASNCRTRRTKRP